MSQQAAGSAIHGATWFLTPAALGKGLLAAPWLVSSAGSVCTSAAPGGLRGGGGRWLVSAAQVPSGAHRAPLRGVFASGAASPASLNAFLGVST